MGDPAVSAYDQWLARREEHRRICAAGGEDRLSALPDDVIRLILRRLDTRSALATAALSKHWARFRRDLPVLEFKVSDILPEQYRRYVRRRLDTPTTRNGKKLGVLARRYERRSMRSLASSMKSFLDADDEAEAEADNARRSAHAMTLELFPTHNPAPFNRLIAKAVRVWGVQDLEIAVLAPTPTPTPMGRGGGHHDHGAVSYAFPHHCFDDLKSPTGLKLKKLKLSNCTPLPAAAPARRDNNHIAAGNDNRAPPEPPLASFSSLTVLVLQGMPKSTRGHVYERVIRACPSLEVLHLKFCPFWGNVSIDAPGSRIMELVIDGCAFVAVALRSLPRLERLALVGVPVELAFGSQLPRLNRLNISFYQDPESTASHDAGPMFPDVVIRNDYSILGFVTAADSSSNDYCCFPDLESLVVRFTGPEIWIVRDEGMPLLGNVKRLLLADMPYSWDISWTCRLLKAMPYLETLHVQFSDHLRHHVGSGMTVVDPVIPEPPSGGFKNPALREVVIVGFKGTDEGIRVLRFLRFLVTNGCNALENVAVLKHGRVCERGLWDWEVMATPPEGFQWSDEERDAVLREIIQGGNSSSTTRIVLG